MKRYWIFVVLLLLFAGCRDQEVTEDANLVSDNENVIWDSLKEKIQLKNADIPGLVTEHLQVPEPRDPEIPVSLSRGRFWEITYVDFNGAAALGGLFAKIGGGIGTVVGAISGGAAGGVPGAGLGATIGGAIGSVRAGVAGALLGGVTASANEYYNGGCAITVPAENYGSVVHEFPFYIDARKPINRGVYAFQGYEGCEVGVMHNYILSELISNPQNNDLIGADAFTIFERVVDVSHNLGLEITDESFLRDVENRIFEILEIKKEGGEYYSLEYLLGDVGFSEEAEILQTYFDNVSTLSETDALEYSFYVIETIKQDLYFVGEDIGGEEGDCLKASAEVLISAISVCANSKLLWNLNLPDPDLSKTFIVIGNNGLELIWSKDELIDRFVSGNILACGIPKIINGKLTEIFFYNNDVLNYVPQLQEFGIPYTSTLLSEYLIDVGTDTYSFDNGEFNEEHFYLSYLEIDDNETLVHLGLEEPITLPYPDQWEYDIVRVTYNGIPVEYISFCPQQY